MIKFASRPNLIYILQLILWNVLRKIEKMIMSELFGFSDTALFSLLMFLGEFLAGLVIYRYQESFVSKNKKLPNLMSIVLIQGQNIMAHPDPVYKIYILIFFTAFFDFIEFTLSVSYLAKFYNISCSLESRLSGILTISAALFFYFLLKLEIFKHQFFSLLIIGICLILVILSEFFFQEIDIFLSYGKFVGSLVIIFFIHFFNSLLDSIEKYLFEYDFFNPFKTLMWEGIFGTIITLIYCFIENYFNDLVIYYKNNSTGNFVGLFFLLFLYIILCGGRNAFRVITNKIYSPMAKTLTDYLLNPIYNIIEYARGKDFILGEKSNILYFIINLVLSLIVTICGCVYNEFIVLFCCKLEYNTHHEISQRASVTMQDFGSSTTGDDDSDDDSLLII